jgi:hypothetical protein
VVAWDLDDSSDVVMLVVVDGADVARGQTVYRDGIAKMDALQLPGPKDVAEGVADA